MMTRYSLLTGAAALMSSVSARAHEGHGLPGVSHWHGTDTLGFVALGLVIAAVIWLRSGK